MLSSGSGIGQFGPTPEMIKAGEAERDRIVAQAEEKAARMRKDTNFLIEQQIKQLALYISALN